MGDDAGDSNPWTIENLAGFLYEEVTRDVPDGWERVEIAARLSNADDSNEISVGYRHFVHGENQPHEFQTTNVFGPMNAISRIEKIMAADGNGWSRGHFTIHPDGNVVIKAG